MAHLAFFWTAVLIAVPAAKKTHLTMVRFFLFVHFLRLNAGIPPTASDDFIREFAEPGIIFIMFALGFAECLRSAGAASAICRFSTGAAMRC